MIQEDVAEVSDPVRMSVVGADRSRRQFREGLRFRGKAEYGRYTRAGQGPPRSIVAAIERTISAWAAGTFTVRFTNDEVLGGGDFEKQEDAATLASYLGREFEFTADSIVEFDTANGEWEVELSN